MTNIGIVFGCFIPMHTGHMDLITKSRLENHKTVLCTTGYDMDRGYDFVPFLRRRKLVHQAYSDGPDIILSHVDDRKLGLTGTFTEEAWLIWSTEMFRNAGLDPNDRGASYHWYTGDPGYIEKLAKVYPSHIFHLVDRAKDPISGTMIREDPYRYKDKIHPLFWQYLEINVYGKEPKSK